MAAIGVFPEAARGSFLRFFVRRVSRWKYAGVVGPDLTAQFFTERAEELGGQESKAAVRRRADPAANPRAA
jgi:hypothetical protein